MAMKTWNNSRTWNSKINDLGLFTHPPDPEKNSLFRDELAGTCPKSELKELRRKLEDAESEITNLKSMTPPRAERFVLAFESYHICTLHEILV